jgi:hypothetical protein
MSAIILPVTGREYREFGDTDKIKVYHIGPGISDGTRDHLDHVIVGNKNYFPEDHGILACIYSYKNGKTIEGADIAVYRKNPGGVYFPGLYKFEDGERIPPEEGNFCYKAHIVLGRELELFQNADFDVTEWLEEWAYPIEV